MCSEATQFFLSLVYPVRARGDGKLVGTMAPGPLETGSANCPHKTLDFRWNAALRVSFLLRLAVSTMLG